MHPQGKNDFSLSRCETRGDPPFQPNEAEREKQGSTLLGGPANSAADHYVPEPWI